MAAADSVSKTNTEQATFQLERAIVAWATRDPSRPHSAVSGQAAAPPKKGDELASSHVTAQPRGALRQISG